MLAAGAQPPSLSDSLEVVADPDLTNRVPDSIVPMSSAPPPTVGMKTATPSGPGPIAAQPDRPAGVASWKGRRRLTAAAAACLLVVAGAMTAAWSFGGDDDTTVTTEAGATDVTEAGGGPETTAVVTEDTEAARATEDTTGIEDGEAVAATDGTEAAASGGEYGLIDGVYVGGGDFVLDPADCPENWDPMQGITDTDITFFSSMPRVGPLAGFGLVGDGIQSYFDYINETEGGVDGKQLHLEVEDDGYQPDTTKTNVDEALGAGAYAGVLAILGTANNLAVWDGTNDECMPQLLNGTGAPHWGDITNHPWTTGMLLDYATEASLWAEWLKTEHPDATTVAAVAFNNDFGNVFVESFERFTEGSDIEVVDQQYHEPTAPDMTNQFTAMAATGADVVLIETTGTFCTQAMAELEKNTSWNPIVIMSATCASLSQFQPLVDQGLTGAGTHIIQYVKDVNDVAFADDEFVQLFHETVKAQGLDDTQTGYATGWVFAYYLVEILKTATTYEGGLDRGNIQLAARNIDTVNPLIVDGVTQFTEGFTDAYLIEGGRMTVYEVADPAQLGAFVAAGDPIDHNGGIGDYDDFLAGG
ncbi:MAG: ABC transporter substrate-binding protein [Ilumatobacteraceae bacterium]